MATEETLTDEQRAKIHEMQEAKAVRKPPMVYDGRGQPVLSKQDYQDWVQDFRTQVILGKAQKRLMKMIEHERDAVERDRLWHRQQAIKEVLNFAANQAREPQAPDGPADY